MNKTLRFFALALPMTVFALFPGPARADLQLNMDQLINGVAPAGSLPWATAVFHTNSVGNVTLTMSNLMQLTEFIPVWEFNVKVNGLFDATPLATTAVSGPVPSSVSASSSQLLNGGANMKAGLFNLQFSWPTPNASPNRFKGGETAVVHITGGDITENSFNFLSAPEAHGFGTYVSAADVRGIPGTGGTVSGSISATVAPVPEVSSIFMLLGVATLLAPAIRAKLG